jgi:hypothetical protein
MWLVHQFEGLTDIEGGSAALTKLADWHMQPSTASSLGAYFLYWPSVCRPLHSSILN